MKISGKTKVCGLIGDPVSHSLSPAFQNAAFEHLGLDYMYIVFTVKKEQVSDAVLAVRSLGLHGLNVTMPHKTGVIPFLDELDKDARSIGSVNTILNRNGKLVGYTTDGVGALRALRHNGVDPSGKKAMVLGAGGASRSVSFALAQEVRELVILNRTAEKAEKLVEDLSVQGYGSLKVTAGPLTDEWVEKELADADVLVNATSVGMFPKEQQTPVNPRFLRPELVVFDLVYEPLQTRLLKEARKSGARVVDGFAVLVFQGAVSFEIWTGKSAPVEVMMEAARKGLIERQKSNSSRGG